MIPEFGHFALILAFCIAMIQAIFPLIGALKNNVPYMILGKRAALGQFIFATLSIAILAYCFLINDFSVAYVAEHSNRLLPLLYRVGAVWGGHEGSLLLWVWILSMWTLAVSFLSRSLPLEMRALVLSVMGMISIGFYLFLLLTSSPFVRLLANIPADGADLSPILQDPGLATHPPILYTGYVGFSVAFAFAIAALISGRLDATWARWSRPWTIVAWSFLTAGIVLGSWWAYRELGWGGFWFWDPVENASFMPWLAGTALIHSLMVIEKRNTFKAWTVLLAVCTFSLSLLGTFLVRSGVLISVHSFAVDSQRGYFLLLFLMIVIGSSLTLYAWRAKNIVQSVHFNLWSRETMLLANNILLFVAMFTILIGTLYPLIADVLQLGKISVGAPYFNSMFGPLMIPLFSLAAIGPFFNWKNTSVNSLLKRLLLVFIFSLLMTTVLNWFYIRSIKLLPFFGLLLAFWILLNTLSHLQKMNWRKRIPMILAHTGLAVTLIGIICTISYSEQRDLSMQIGDEVTIGPYQFSFKNVADFKGPNYDGVRGTIAVEKNAKLIAMLHPELRTFNSEQVTLSKTDIQANVFRDLYVALGAPLKDNSFEIRIYYKPFVRWIWVGGLLMVLAGFCSVFNFKRRRDL
jgi:cytochrome c-type biogenesis protein CcmF